MGPFLEHVLPVTSCPIQQIQLAPEPTQGQEKEGIPWHKTMTGQDGHALPQGLPSKCPLLCPVGF